MSSHTEHQQPIRATLRSTGFVGVAGLLTAGVLVLIGSLVDTWA